MADENNLVIGATVDVEQLPSGLQTSVEASGIWIECQTLTDKVLSGACAGVSEVTPVFFFPWSMVAFIAGVAGRPTVSRNFPRGKFN